MRNRVTWLDERSSAANRLNTDNLLRDYARISSRRRGAAIATARRAQANSYLDILATEAAGSPTSWRQLRGDLLHSYTEGGIGRMRSVIRKSLKPTVVGEVANYLLLSSKTESEQMVGLTILRAVLGLLPYDREVKKWRRNCVQALILQKKDNEVRALLKKWKETDNSDRGYLRAELKNPYRFGTEVSNPDADYAEWLNNFNLRFVAEGIAPVELEIAEKKPFDRLTAKADVARIDMQDTGPLISVVMTSFQPNRDELETSVRSILNQTVSDLELIIVDDASGPEYDSLFDEVATWDDRIRVEKMPENGGTYVCRNRGLTLARGEFYTGQDDDDWSHPQRLEFQLRQMLDDPNVAACKVGAVRCGENLGRVFLGYSYRSGNASSLMVRVSLLRRLGGFMPVRKAADTELAERIGIETGREVVTIDKPLTVVRILSDSLSRSDFSAGWSHPTRDSYKSAYKLWHSTAGNQELRLNIDDQNSVPIFAPRRISGAQDGFETSYDVVLAGDWKKYGGPQKSMLEEVKALTGAGLKVAILHLEAARFMSNKIENLNDPVQTLLNEGIVDQIFYDDEASAKLLVLRYPPILQFPPDEPSKLDVGRLVILANQAPSEKDGTDIRYLVRDCTEHARFMFGTDPVWAPQGPQVRRAIETYLDDFELCTFDLPGIVDPRDWQKQRIDFSGRRIPVIGRHSRDDRMKWPETREQLLAAYPNDGSVKVRAMGGRDIALKVLGQTEPPKDWELLDRDQEKVRDFLHSLDFYVFFQNTNAIEAFGRSILEAIAANLVVILPPHYEEVFGRAAVYCSAEDVSEIIQTFRENPKEYYSQVERAREVLNLNYTHDSYLRKIQSFVVHHSK